jgi:alpha-galactosidase
MFNKPLMQLRLKVAGLNHFGFLLGLEDIKTGKDLMPEFNAKALDYFKDKWDRWQFSDLTFEVYKRFGYFPYTGDNHLGEFLIFGEEFTKTQDMIDWINRTDQGGKAVYDRILRSYKRLNKGSYPKGGILAKVPSGERAINIIEAIIENRNSYENAVNVSNDGLIDNLPQDLIVEVPVHVNKDGVQGIKIGLLSKNIAAILRIEASIQDVYVEAILNKSKDLALAAVAMDPNVGSFKMADAIFAEMMELQKEYLSYFK